MQYLNCTYHPSFYQTFSLEMSRTPTDLLTTHFDEIKDIVMPTLRERVPKLREPCQMNAITFSDHHWCFRKMAWTLDGKGHTLEVNFRAVQTPWPEFLKCEVSVDFEIDPYPTIREWIHVKSFVMQMQWSEEKGWECDPWVENYYNSYLHLADTPKQYSVPADMTKEWKM